MAPGRVKSDLQTVATAIVNLTAALETVNYDATKLPPTVAAAAYSPAVQQASGRIQTYNHTVCNVPSA